MGAPSSRGGELSLRELFDRIHRVNPTGRSLSRAEMDARYAEKNKLQSALVRDFSEVLRFRTERDPRVVAIGHESLGLDGCHAIIEELEEDARSLVRRALDEAAAPPAPPPRDSERERQAAARGDAPPPPSPSATGALRLLDEGARALAEYDYDGARAALEAAFAASRGGVAAAVALLSLLLDHLADDAAARALADALGADARADPVVRARVALADARLGNERDAEQRVIGVEVPEVAEVWLAFAEASVARGEPSRAEEQLARARSYDPSNGRLSDVGRKVAALRDAHQGEREADLRARWHAGQRDEARALARSIVATFGDSRDAREILARLAATDRLDAARARFEDARTRAADGELGLARTLLLSAAAELSGGDDREWDGLRSEIDAERVRVERRMEDRETDAAVEHAIAQLASPPEMAARAFLALRPDRRLVAIERSSHHPSRRIFEAARRLRATRPQASDAEVAGAISALEGARLAVEAVEAGSDDESHPERVLSALEAHRSLLDALADAREPLEAFHLLVASFAASRAARARLRGSELRSNGDTGGAIAALEAADLRGAHPDVERVVARDLAELRARADAEAIEAELARVLGEERPIEDARTAAQLLDARALVDRLRAHLGDYAVSAWSELAERRREAVGRHLDVTRHPGATPSWYLRPTGGRMRSVRAGGAEVVIPHASDAGLALHRYDLERSTVVETIRLRLFAPPELSSLAVRGALAVIADRSGVAYELDLDAAEILRVHPSRAIDPRGDLEFAWSDELYLWYGGDTGSRTIQANSGVVVRQAWIGWRTQVLPGPSGDVVDCVASRAGRASLFSPAGKSLGTTFAHAAVARAPTGGGYLLFVDAYDREPEVGFARCVSASEPSRWAGPQLALRQWSWERPTHAATSTDEGLTFVLMYDEDQAVLRAFDLDPDLRPNEVWSVPVAQDASLAEDWEGRCVVLIEPREARGCDARVVVLGRAPPASVAAKAELELEVEAMAHGWARDCAFDPRRFHVELQRSAARSSEQSRALVEELAAHPARGPELTPQILRGAIDWVHAEDRLAHLGALPTIRPLLVEVALRTARWEAFEVRMNERSSPGAAPLSSPGDRTQHDAHLDVLHALLGGRFDDARDALDVMRARASEGREATCPEEALRAYVEEVRAAALDEPNPSVPESETLARLRSLLLADAHIDAGDLDAAWATLDRRLFWNQGELHHLSRAALVVLSRELRSAADRTRAWLVLRRFLEVSHPSYWNIRARFYPLPPRWTRRHLDDLVVHARRTLDGLARERG